MTNSKNLKLTNDQAILQKALLLNAEERLLLIDELAANLPDNQPPQLSHEWTKVINRRSQEIDLGSVKTEDWESIRSRLIYKINFAKEK
ncbi:addiction module protein [Rubinisphaera italica]|uniref:Putative addiction module component n=1 Tax=Rubinisphaera italica TaxID=2527969 RepID=A0A5C5XKM9_9PLAN|nr:addiction module protein [Rubinisphaera italica]TWT63490.1 putative addiction module component [Rubinisphaera italica]